MILPAIVLTLAAAAQAGSAVQAGQPVAAQQRALSHTFISPMGEPFRIGGSGEVGLEAWFRQADANHDGAVTSDEMKADSQRFFLVLDRNHDGEIDPEDLEHYETEVAPEIRSGMSWGGVTGDRVNDEATGGGRLGLLAIPEPVAAADTNLNRGVSEVEFEQAAAKRFRMLDTDGDGRLTVAELEARRQAVRSNARRPLRSKEPAPPPELPESTDPGMIR